MATTSPKELTATKLVLLRTHQIFVASEFVMGVELHLCTLAHHGSLVECLRGIIYIRDTGLVEVLSSTTGSHR